MGRQAVDVQAARAEQVRRLLEPAGVARDPVQVDQRRRSLALVADHAQRPAVLGLEGFLGARRGRIGRGVEGLVAGHRLHVHRLLGGTPRKEYDQEAQERGDRR